MSETCTASRHGSRRAYRHGCRCPDVVERVRASWRRKMPAGRSQRSIRDRSREVDPIAVERACMGDPVRLTIRERALAIQRLDRLGLTARVIGDRLGLAARTVQRYRAGQVRYAREDGMKQVGERRTFVVTMWKCPRGHFVANEAINCEDYRDDFAYYGIRTECRYTCRACGETYEDLPRCVEVRRTA